jgi:hypothetical protein
MATRKTTSKPAVDERGFGPQLTAVLKEMCHRVKADYSAIDFKSADWFRKHSWTLKEQSSFEQWLAGRLLKNRATLRELTDRRYVNKAWCLKAAKEFTFMYGWSLSDFPTVSSQDPKCTT